MKSAYYVAVVTRVYRQALDCLQNPEPSSFSSEQIELWKNELTRVSHRRYNEGFIDVGAGVSSPRDLQYLKSSAYIRGYHFCALVLEVLEDSFKEEGCKVRLNVKDRLTAGAEVEVITPGMQDFMTSIISLQKENGDEIDVAHPGTVAVAYCRVQLKAGNILRQAVIGVTV
jgi:putative protease